LSSDGRHIDITSKDREFLDKLQKRIGIDVKIGVKYNGLKQRYFHFQISNKNFYDFLFSIGLTPHKSLTIGAIKVPEQYFGDFLRGLIDGDGCIRSWTHSTNKREQWSLRIYSGSEEFINWLNSIAEQLFKVRGKIHKNTANTWVLKYGKMAARYIMQQCYYPGSFGLERKALLAEECINSNIGWSRSKTLFN
jgi:hypothetical protein